MRKKLSGLPQQSRLLLGLILSIFSLAFILTSDPIKAPLPVGGKPYEIPDGVWYGAFSGSDAITISETYAESNFNGSMDLTVIAGEVSGYFDAHGSSSSENSEGYGIATFNADGQLGGTAQEPWMLTLKSVMDYAIEVQGYETTFQLEMTNGFPVVDLVLMEAANCNSMSGNFDSSVMQSLENANANVVGIQTEFTITRFTGISTGSIDTYSDKLLELLKKADSLISKTLKEQALDADLLMEVVKKADGLNSGIYYDITCNIGKSKHYFNTAIVGIIVKLINLAYAHPDWFTTQQINQITFAALSTGAIGAGSPNEDLAVNLTNLLEEIATDKLNEALKNPKPDCGDIYALYTTSQIIGTESLLPKTTDAMNKYQCGGS